MKIHQLRKKLIGTAGVVALPKEDVSCSRDLGVRKDVSSAEVLTMKQIYAVMPLMTKDVSASAPTSVFGFSEFFTFLDSCIPY